MSKDFHSDCSEEKVSEVSNRVLRVLFVCFVFFGSSHVVGCGILELPGVLAFCWALDSGGVNAGLAFVVVLAFLLRLVERNKPFFLFLFTGGFGAITERCTKRKYYGTNQVGKLKKMRAKIDDLKFTFQINPFTLHELDLQGVTVRKCQNHNTSHLEI